MTDEKKRFFITVIPGMESVAYLELCDLWALTPSFLPPPQAEFFKGGLEIEAPLAVGCELNRWLRLSNRILLRWLDFPAPNIAAFKGRVADLPWAHYFAPGSRVDLQYSSRSSKLSYKKQILQTLEPFLEKHNISNVKGGHKVFFRFFRDHCQVSIDTTGERGQFRGKNKKVAAASLRDNTAAGLIRMLFQGLDLSKYTLIDPMAGSGTFLLEALQWRHPLNRSFAFESFPLLTGEKAYVESSVSSTINAALAIERDKKVVAATRENLSQIGQGKIQIIAGDYRKVSADDFPEPRLMIVNPPWGKRLKSDLSQDWLGDLLRTWLPDRLGILWPSRPLPDHPGYEVVRRVWLENSGVKNQFAVLIPRASSSATGKTPGQQKR